MHLLAKNKMGNEDGREQQTDSFHRLQSYIIRKDCQVLIGSFSAEKKLIIRCGFCPAICSGLTLPFQRDCLICRPYHLVCRLLLEKKKKYTFTRYIVNQ